MAVNLKIKNQSRRAEYINAPDMPVRQIHKFIDLKLDIEQMKVGNPLFFNQEIVNGTDISIAIDEQAISAYLKNLFSCSPGDLYLNPDFGLNLKQFLFEPVTEETARSIGYYIDNAIKDLNFFSSKEEFVKVKNIIINPDINNGLFEIAIILIITPLSKEIILFGEISPTVGVLFYTK